MGHRTCPDRGSKHLNVLLGFVKHEAKTLESKREAGIISGIRDLIRESCWQNMVNPGKVLNLTVNEVSNEELEILSLGTDFKLQTGNEIILDVAVGFENFDFKHKHESNKPDLQRDKVRLLSDIHKDNKLILPRRYFKALRSLKANGNIKVVQADKGRQVTIIYMETWRNLINNHYGDTMVYKPVEPDDVAGYDLKRFTDDFNQELNDILNQYPDEGHRKIAETCRPRGETRFPKGRVNLKTHKPGVTSENIPVRPIVSNINSPTAPLASYLGKCLTSMLGQVSDKHIESTEHFARTAINCGTEGRILSLDVESLFTCIPTSRVIDFLRDKSGGYELNPPPGGEYTYNFGMNSKIFCDLVELCLKYNQFEVEGSFYRQIHGLFMGSSISPPLAQMYMEYWEEFLYEPLIPDDIKANVW